ncbi:MAG: cysteine--tRNA ligase [Pseudomonadales bacterium]|nr:cysteine--tRNA ligase [Pseudomonadales bacterium]MCP5185913.1 cysteine--tRNA ligase [Pseudomonadales bacterium]
MTLDIKLHNTASGRKETFVPHNPDRVTMYVCGPTVYNFVHIGNARPFVAFDVLARLLRTQYPQVVYARNITDVDDKINRQALANGEPIQALADRYAETFEEDMRALWVLPPTVTPRATHHIPQIIELIETLIAKGHAYAAEGHVLFAVNSDPNYGHLSHRSLEDILAGARVEIAPYKRDPKDFVLWKPSTPELPGWDSPWGRGRPGWHIECSAMSYAHLGAEIDIHGGGSDLIFPHHENESAQSRCALGTPHLARYWLHNGMLTLGQEKMSKSVGNIETIVDLRKRYPAEQLRYALLLGHYRSPLAWSPELLAQAKASLDRLYQALREIPSSETASALQHADTFPVSVTAALADDLNTPEALSAMHALASALNRSTDDTERANLRRHLLAGGWLLGLLEQHPETWFTGTAEGSGGLDTDAIEARIEARNEARRQKDFAGADAIRDELAAQGIELEDTRQGTRWRRTDS